MGSNYTVKTNPSIWSNFKYIYINLGRKIKNTGGSMGNAHIKIFADRLEGSTNHTYYKFKPDGTGETRNSCKMIPCSVETLIDFYEESQAWRMFRYSRSGREIAKTVNILIIWTDSDGQANVEILPVSEHVY